MGHNRRRIITNIAVIIALIVLALVSSTRDLSARTDDAEPEAKTSIRTAISDARSHEFMVVTANPLASQTAVAILRRGGSAMDAAIAAQMVLNVVEPQSSGIGGGGFLLHYDGKSGKIDAYDGREKAPAAMPPHAFLDDKGRPDSFLDASTGGMAVGVPGLLAMLKLGHDDHGKMAWSPLFDDAIRTARQGFSLSPRLHELLGKNLNLHTLSPDLPFFDTEGQPRTIGSLVRINALAETFELLAADPLASFYSGSIARRIVERVRHAPKDPGVITMADLRSDQARRRPPLCGHYRDHRLCGMPLPTSGTIAILQMLSILSHFPCCSKDLLDADTIARIGAVQHAVYRERTRYLGDDDYADIDQDWLLDPQRLEDIARHISWPPQAVEAPLRAGSISTTHLSIIDAEGNAVALTSSIGPAFGSKLSVGGFLLNGELTDFQFRSSKNGILLPNRIEGGKRPLSSMSPIFVFAPNGTLQLVIGSPGGTGIIAYVLQTILAVLDYDMAIHHAVALPHFVNRRGVIELEKDQLQDQARQLRQSGFKVKQRSMTSGLHGITIDDQGEMHGAADPRREGRAMGPSS